jgi:RNA polymerase sigma factor (sigma-70 family)
MGPSVRYKMERADEIEEFVDVERHRLVGALIVYGCDASTADDIAQEALARLWERWASVRDPLPWLYRVAFNLARSRWRRLKRERGSPVSAEELSTLPDIELAAQLRFAVDQLPARQRMAVVMRYYRDLSVTQTATAMGCSEGTVKATTNHAVARLRIAVSAMEVLDA